MHIPLAVAIVALLALMMLPVLDRAGSEINAKRPRSYLTRIARWVNE